MMMMVVMMNVMLAMLELEQAIGFSSMQQTSYLSGPVGPAVA